MTSLQKVIWNENKTFEFDCVFDENTTQTQIYASLVQKLLVDLLNGYSATVLVYGPNGCGKTYTLGSNSAAITSLTNSRVTTITKRPQLNDFDGVLPRVLDDLISFIDYEQQQSQQSQHRPEYENDDDDDDNDEKEEEEEDADKETPTLSVKLSLFELYQKEIVKDLFVNRLYASSSQSSTDSSLLVVTNTAVPSPPPRLPHRTEFTISLEQPPVRHNRRQPNGSLDLVKSQLRFIKVAGWVKSSKVSRFLHDALLETDSNVILIACVNPAEAHMTETLNMLDWAADVMKINKTTKECVAKKDNERELNELRAQVEELKAQVAKLTCEAKSGHIESPGSCDEKLMKVTILTITISTENILYEYFA